MKERRGRKGEREGEGKEGKEEDRALIESVR